MGRYEAAEPRLLRAGKYGPVLRASRRQPRLIVDLVENEIVPRKLRLDAFAGSAVISSIGATRQWQKALGILELIDQVMAANGSARR